MRILGIDLGTTSVKAVEVDSAFGRFEIRDYHENKIVPDEGPAKAVARLMRGLPKPPDRVVVTIPTQQTTFRNLKLPTRDRKAILAGVTFELEDELPFALEKSVYDYSVLASTKQSSELHVAATLQSRIAQALEVWTEAGVDPDIITTESWSYRSFLNRVLAATEQSEPVLLIDMGKKHSTFYVHWKGTPVLARGVLWGGDDLTRAFEVKYEFDPEKAEASKLDHGFVMPKSQEGDLTPEQAEISKTLMGPVEELIQEIRQAEFTCKNSTHHNLGRIYLTGGSSLLPGLSRTLEERIGLPVRPLQALSSVADSGVTYSEQSDATFLLATATALCLVGSDRGATINLRKGAFAKKGVTRELNLATLRRPLLSGGAITLSLFVSLMVESSIYRSRLTEVDAQLERSLKQFFGTVSSSAVRTYLSDTNKLRSNIDKELNKHRELGKLTGPNARTPIEFLKNLSTSIPKDVVVDMTQFQVGAAPSAPYSSTADQSASLSFYVYNPQIAERLADLVKPKVSGMQRGKMEESTSAEGVKRWKITFTGKPSEDVYGK